MLVQHGGSVRRDRGPVDLLGVGCRGGERLVLFDDVDAEDAGFGRAVLDEVGRALGHLEGVDQVINKIDVLPLSPFDDQIRLATYRSIFGFGGLYRYAMGSVPSVHIIVDNGHVTLEGLVDNQGDKNLANIRANGVAGVFSVTNNLQVAGRS